MNDFTGGPPDVSFSLATENKEVADVWAGTVKDGVMLPLMTHDTAWHTLASKKDSWQQALAGLVGVYGLIKQHGVIKDYLKLAKEQVAQAERYLKLAESNYNEIAVPVYKAQRALFDRYLAEFGGYETKFVNEAFRLDEYCPEYKLQEGRAIATVQAQFDRAQRNRRRQTGKYNSGRACHDATMFAIQTALAKTAAINHAYRFEEARKDRLDIWYFERKMRGATLVSDMANRVVSGLNGGSAGATNGLAGIGSAVAAGQSAFDARASGYGQLASFYGGVSNFGFSTAAYGMGRNAVNPYGGGMGSGGFGGGLAQAPSVGGGMSIGNAGMGSISGIASGVSGLLGGGLGSNVGQGSALAGVGV